MAILAFSQILQFRTLRFSPTRISDLKPVSRHGHLAKEPRRGEIQFLRPLKMGSFLTPKNHHFSGFGGHFGHFSAFPCFSKIAPNPGRGGFGAILRHARPNCQKPRFPPTTSGNPDFRGFPLGNAKGKRPFSEFRHFRFLAVPLEIPKLLNFSSGRRWVLLELRDFPNEICRNWPF